MDTTQTDISFIHHGFEILNNGAKSVLHDSMINLKQISLYSSTDDRDCNFFMKYASYFTIKEESRNIIICMHCHFQRVYININLIQKKNKSMIRLWLMMGAEVVGHPVLPILWFFLKTPHHIRCPQWGMPFPTHLIMKPSVKWKPNPSPLKSKDAFQEMIPRRKTPKSEIVINTCRNSTKT